MEMSLIKKILPVLVALLVIAIAWVGFSLYFQETTVDVDPDATNYTKPINSSFDTEVIEEVSIRTEESFPVSPQEFLKLNDLN
jgi:Cu/Ag efflux pump CusA